MKMTREFYKKKGAVKIAPKDINAEFYIYETSKGKPACQCFIGKAAKPNWHYSFQTSERMEKKIADQIESIKISNEMKAARKAKAQEPCTWAVGDILSSSWGYDQTNVSFFKVLKLIGKRSVECVRISSREVEGSEGFMCCNVVAGSNVAGKPFKALVSNNSIKISYSEYASPWDGKPMYSSWYA
jgi:hypothetical protein